MLGKHLAKTRFDLGIFSFLNREKPSDKELSYKNLAVDLHSHLIPGVDDGVNTIEEAIALAEHMEKMGFRKLITTPHIMLDGYRNTPDIIRSKLEAVQEALDRSHLSITIDAAAEYYLDEGMRQHLQKGELLTFADNYILFEIAFMNRPSGLEEMVYEMLAKGYKPILAHPERYPYLYSADLEAYAKLREAGLLFQVNIPSLVGAYTQGARDMARKLIGAGMVDFIASDLHNEHQLVHLYRAMKDEHTQRAIENFSIRNRQLL